MTATQQQTGRGFHDQPFAVNALCAQTDPKAFFPEKGGSTREAKAVCAQCTVRDDCLIWALASGERFGIFGGLSERERRKLKKQQTAAASTETTAPDIVVDQAEEQQPARPDVYLGTYVSATGHRPLPMATDTYRKAHAPQKPRPTGLDWSKHRAPDAAPDTPAPPKKAKRDHAAGTAAGEDLVAQRYSGPTQPSLQAELEQLERTDPAVAETAAAYDDMAAEITHPEDHIKAPEPPTEGKQGKPTTRRSAPRATSSSASSTTGRAPVAGSSTTQEKKNPPTVQETRPATVGGPTVHHLDQLIDQLATARATMTTELARIELALEAVRQSIAPPPAPAAASPPPTPRAAAGPTGFKTFPRTRRTRSTLDITQATNLYLQHHHSCSQIAEQLGSTTSTVRRCLVAAGVPMRDDRARNSGGRNAKTITDYPPQLVAEIRHRYVDQEQTVAHIAEQLGHGSKFVTTILKRDGVARRPPASVAGRKGKDQKLDDAKRADICRRYQAGESSTALASAYGVSSPTVFAVLRRNDISVRDHAAARINHLNRSGATA